MSQLSEKELNTIKDLLSEEELLVKKFQMLAQHGDTVNGSTSTTETVTAATATDQLIAGVLHSFHNGQAFRNFILFSEKIDIN